MSYNFLLTFALETCFNQTYKKELFSKISVYFLMSVPLPFYELALNKFRNAPKIAERFK